MLMKDWTQLFWRVRRDSIFERIVFRFSQFLIFDSMVVISADRVASCWSVSSRDFLTFSIFLAKFSSFCWSSSISIIFSWSEIFEHSTDSWKRASDSCCSLFVPCPSCSKLILTFITSDCINRNATSVCILSAIFCDNRELIFAFSLSSPSNSSSMFLNFFDKELRLNFVVFTLFCKSVHVCAACLSLNNELFNWLDISFISDSSCSIWIFCEISGPLSTSVYIHQIYPF